MRQDLGVGTSLKVKVGRVGKQSVISRNFGFRLSDEQLQAAADILKMYDGNIRSTKEEKVKDVVLTVIEGSVEEIEQKIDGGKGGNVLKISKHLIAVYESRATASQSRRQSDEGEVGGECRSVCVLKDAEVFA